MLRKLFAELDWYVVRLTLGAIVLVALAAKVIPY